MDDPEPVRFGHGDARLEDELDGLGDGERSRLPEPYGEIAPVEELHDEIRSPRLERPDVDDPRDVLASDLHNRPGLAGEAGDGLLVFHHRREEEFDGDFGVELQVAGSDDDAHAAGAEDPLDLVFCPRGRRPALRRCQGCYPGRARGEDGEK